MLFAVLVIAGSFYARNQRIAAVNHTEPVLPVSERAYIETADTNNDGVTDWREAFAGRIQTERVFRPDEVGTETYEVPNTVTGQMAQEVFKNYIQVKGTGELPAGFEEQVLAATVHKAQNLQQPKAYSAADIRVIESSPTAIRAYGNNVAEAMLNNTTQDVPVQIFMDAVKNNRTADLAKLDDIITLQKEALEAVRLVPVPRALEKQHIILLDALSKIAFDTEAMRNMYTDPMLTLIRMGEFEKTLTHELFAYKSIAEVLIAHNITYSKDEFGSFFISFE